MTCLNVGLLRISQFFLCPVKPCTVWLRRTAIPWAKRRDISMTITLLHETFLWLLHEAFLWLLHYYTRNFCEYYTITHKAFLWLLHETFLWLLHYYTRNFCEYYTITRGISVTITRDISVNITQNISVIITLLHKIFLWLLHIIYKRVSSGCGWRTRSLDKKGSSEFNKQSRTADKGCSPRLGVVRGSNNSSPSIIGNLRNVTQGLAHCAYCSD